MPRVDLASSVGLTTGAVTRITAEMSERGLIRELDPLTSSEAGRRRVPIDARAEAFVVGGIHVGLDSTYYGLVDLRGNCASEVHQRQHGELSVRDALLEAIDARDQLIGEVPSDAQFVGTGLISGGFAVRGDGVVATSEMLGWSGEQVDRLLAELTDGDFAIDSAYRALSRAEMWFGATRDVRNFVYIFLGNLVGASIVVDQQVYDGVGARAGQVIHLPVSGDPVKDCACGRVNCFNSVAGLDAIVEGAAAAGLVGVRSWDGLMKLANEGDAIATRLCEQRMEALGEIIAIVVDLLAPERVVLSGGGTTSDVGLEVIRSTVERFRTAEFDPEEMVKPTGLGPSVTANVVAAATPALASFYQDPLGEAEPERTAGASR